MQECDEPILASLTDVECSVSEGSPMTFTLTFKFAPNDFFSNAALTKTYTLTCAIDAKDPFAFDGPEIVACTGSRIEWKAKEKNVTVKQIKKKQKHKQKGNTRFVTKEVKADSFFNFFDPPAHSPDTDLDELDDDTRDLLNADFELGQILRDRVVPRAVLYFTGEAADDDDDFDVSSLSSPPSSSQCNGRPGAGRGPRRGRGRRRRRVRGRGRRGGRQGARGQAPLGLPSSPSPPPPPPSPFAFPLLPILALLSSWVLDGLELPV